MLELKQLSKSFGGRTAVDSMSFSLVKGEVLGFLGQNGAGKSTTMRMAAGVIEPDSGDVIVSGHSIVSDRREAQRRLGFLPEGAPLYPDMTPLDFLNFLCAAHRISRKDCRSAVERVIADARIGDVMSKRVSTLSKGYRRRVGLAGALIHDPDVLILDEPTDGLDPIQKRAVRALISRMAKDKAIVISTHTLEEVPAMCNRVIIIDQGKLIADSSPEEMAKRREGGLEEAFIDLVSKQEAVRNEG
ncbi:ABC transporter ATP-binding protein [Henriciella marina]|uniref:ABC transporter ATP-binding protein n=1 Tax=Henriciella marina TaxID=453851 RepID=A0ABT4LR12_9PROT|nr:ABC transporter ATP-binding protein [Henriciella marina]MCH2458191.1 ABC transporter ATP-binding protein [Henriciella sp.]MCZ4296796.1 ABC transporter ATP-binding protein [Henriciella marina]